MAYAAAQPQTLTPYGLAAKQGLCWKHLGEPTMTSAALSSPVLKKWVELQEDRGSEAAFQALANSKEAEESAKGFDISPVIVFRRFIN